MTPVTIKFINLENNVTQPCTEKNSGTVMKGRCNVTEVSVLYF